MTKESADDLEPNTVDPSLLAILVCPVTKAPLEYDEQAGELISKSAGLAYPIRNGIPILLKEEAEEQKDNEQKKGLFAIGKKLLKKSAA